jgi:uracil-DNA glycosylase
MKPDHISTWAHLLASEYQTESFKSALQHSLKVRELGHTIYPAPEHVFRAFTETPLDTLKVVLLGQDPYHGPDQAEGLCFSVPVGVRIPPSLRNIYRELAGDLGIPIAPHGHLLQWAHEGVLLLNSVLTVEADRPGSHANTGWEQFTDSVIQKISDTREHVVFLLWGNHARKKLPLIDQTKHTVLQAPHPSPLSAYSGFFGCKHFSQTNEILISHGLSPINWEIPPHKCSPPKL